MIPYLYCIFFPIFVNYYLKNKSLDNILWVFHYFFLVILIGLRNDIGGDWIGYQENFNSKNFFSTNSDFAFDVIKFFVKNTYNNFFFYNLIISILFVTPIFYILSKNELRWLLISSIFPIIIILLGMGFIRQGLAFSFGLLFLYFFLFKKNFFLGFLFMLISILFHKLSIIHIFFYILTFIIIFRKYYLLAVCILIAILFYFIFNDIILRNFYFYLGGGQHLFSKGVFLRALILGSIIFSIFYTLGKKENRTLDENFVYILSLICLFLFQLAFFSSTFADRLLLYFHSIPILFFSNKFIFENYKKIYFFNYVIYISYFFIWVMFGTFAAYWVPYKWII